MLRVLSKRTLFRMPLGIDAAPRFFPSKDTNPVCWFVVVISWFLVGSSGTGISTLVVSLFPFDLSSDACRGFTEAWSAGGLDA